MPKSLLLLHMMDLLRERPGLSIGQIAQELGRSERTIYRYLESLSTELHLPVYCEQGGYYLAERPVSSRLGLSPKEVLAVRLALTSGALNRPGPFGDYAVSAWRKIEDALSGDTLESVQESIGRHAIHMPIFSDGDTDSSIVDSIADAVERNKRLCIVYRSQQSGETKPLIIAPYAIVFRRHNWYIIAFSKDHDRVVQLKLIRIVRVEDTGESFKVPHDFSVDGFYSKSWEMWTGGEETLVRIRFSKKVAPIIRESKRHPTQHLEDTADGEVILSVKVAGVDEIGFWVLSWGANAEVLEPVELRESIEKTLYGMMDIYSCQSPWMQSDSFIIAELSERDEVEPVS